MGHATALGPAREVEVSGARIAYHDVGDGPVVVFIHGLLVNADLWRKVVPEIVAAGYRCIVPDLPLGAHSTPVPGADLTPPGVARLIAGFLERLDLDDVTLVANDTGGALTQIMLAENPSRVGRVILTPCDAYEKFFPPAFAGLTLLAKLPGSIRPITELMRIRALHRLPIAFGWVAKRPIEAQTVDSYLLPSRNSAAIRKDLRRFLKSVNRRYTLAAAEKFSQLTMPVLVIWSREEKLFPVELGERLVAALPNARMELIDDSYTFIPEDQPDLLAAMIVGFTREHGSA
ncbi:alpha/beta hydrolase [Skermania sp. ID1734]|uniref:alpha/beta fold hydrolase n=1 Tax=Skermania sp. ID1734 TaxID=2597516 RepID=UPI00117D9EFE|nr:alpha/beta hydrolase [Skermania sp. ID1734]TSD96542.1 alpha/beta hydrolase [Skermania sp. ID1734]